MSSTQVARCGNRSQTHLPHWPYCWNFHFGPTTRPSFFLPPRPNVLTAIVLPSSVVELRLVVEGIDVARPAVHEEEDDALGLGRQRRRLGRQRVGELVRRSRPRRPCRRSRRATAGRSGRRRRSRRRPPRGTRGGCGRRRSRVSASHGQSPRTVVPRLLQPCSDSAPSARPITVAGTRTSIPAAQSRYINSFRFSAIRQKYFSAASGVTPSFFCSAVDQVQRRGCTSSSVGGRDVASVQPQPHLPAARPAPLRGAAARRSSAACSLHELAVEQRQRLRRLRRGEAHRRTCDPVSARSKFVQDRHQQRPLDVDVDAAPRLLLRRRLAPAVARHRLAGQHLRRDLGIDARAVHLQVQVAARPPGSSRGSPPPSAAACRSARTGRSPGRGFSAVGVAARRHAVGVGQSGSSGAAASAASRRPRTPTASQSSSSGCVGLSPCRPKLFGERTMPRPKWYCQRRLTITRAVSRVVLRRDPVGQDQPPAARLRVLRRLGDDRAASRSGSAGSAARPCRRGRGRCRASGRTCPAPCGPSR